MIEEALLLQENTKRLKRELLESYQKRDLKLISVTRFLRNSRDILAGVNDNEMKVLGQWGYDVFDVRTNKSMQPPSVARNQSQLPA